MQGLTEFELFKKEYMKTDEELTKFFSLAGEFITGDTLAKKIDNAIWLQHKIDAETTL